MIWIKRSEHGDYIDGTVLDFTKDTFKEGFKFANPNVKDQCGCGESFSV